MNEPYKETYEGYDIEMYGNITNIFNASNQSRITQFWRELSLLEAKRFVDGYISGLEAGKQVGQLEEGERIRKVLGI